MTARAIRHSARLGKQDRDGEGKYPLSASERARSLFIGFPEIRSDSGERDVSFARRCDLHTDSGPRWLAEQVPGLRRPQNAANPDHENGLMRGGGFLC